MGTLESLVVYAVLGVVVAATVLLQETPAAWTERCTTAVLATVFWPLYAPGALAKKGAVPPPPPAGAGGRVRAAEAQLLASLARVQGGAGELVSAEVSRVQAMLGSVQTLEQRVAEMDALLRTPEFDVARARSVLEGLRSQGLSDDDARLRSVQARVRNIERLAQMRESTAKNLELILLRLEEVGSRLRLLEFAGQPDAEVVALIKEMADAVEAVSDGMLGAE
jgi:hypothetical protein